jgi:hypothetical protein
LEEAERGLRIVPLDCVVRSSFPKLNVNEAQARRIRHGRLTGVILPDSTTALLDATGPDAVAVAVFV